MRIVILPVSLLAALAACQPRAKDADTAASEASFASAEEVEVQAPDTTEPLIDPQSPKLVVDPANRRYTHSVSGDFDGDGTEEDLVVLADVGLDENSRPLWDDNQPWVAYVEEPDGTRTYLFARRVHWGTVDLRLMPPAADRTRAIVLIEDTRDRVGTYELRYRGPNAVDLVRRTEETVEPPPDVVN